MFLQRPSELLSERGLVGEGPGDHLSLQVPLLLLVLSCQASERLLITQTLPWSESGSVSTDGFISHLPFVIPDSSYPVSLEMVLSQMR